MTIQAYERGAALANIALNLTGPLFDGLQHPEAFAPFGDKRAAFIRARNCGYAFAVLARHAAETDNALSIGDWITDVLGRSGLPPYDAILQTAYAGLEALSRGLPVRSDLDRVRDYVLEVGRNRFVQHASRSFSAELFDPLGGVDGPMPPMFDRNGDLFHAGDQPLDQARFDPEMMHYGEMQLRGFTRNFLLGCRGFDPS